MATAADLSTTTTVVSPIERPVWLLHGIIAGESAEADVIEAEAHALAVPDVVLWIYMVVICFFGLVLNLIIVRALVRTKCNGTLYFLLQLTICDIGSLLIAGIELVYMNHSKWMLPPELCSVYLGIESFINTATVYLIVAINFHTISTYNLAIKTIRREEKFNEEQGRSSIYSPSASLSADPPQSVLPDDDYEVAINHHQQLRSLTIDYSQRKNSVSVMLPVIFIWFLSASVSIPLFVFGNIMPGERTSNICGIISFDTNNTQLMQLLVMIVRIAWPTLLMALTSVCVLLKLYLAKYKIRPCGLEEDVTQILRLTAVISVTFILFSMQRVYGSLLFEMISSRPFMHYKYPEFDKITGIVFCMIHYSASALRPMVYYMLDKNVREEFGWSCCRRKKHVDAEGKSNCTADHPNLDGA